MSRDGDSAPSRRWSWYFDLPAGHACFDGHFDDGAVLPGVAHLAFAATACRVLGLRASAPTGVQGVRFTRPLVPGDECEVQLSEAPDASVRFQILCRGDAASQGVLVFGNEAAGAP